MESKCPDETTHVQDDVIMKTRLFKYIENFTTKKMRIFR